MLKAGAQVIDSEALGAEVDMVVQLLHRCPLPSRRVGTPEIRRWSSSSSCASLRTVVFIFQDRLPECWRSISRRS